VSEGDQETTPHKEETKYMKRFMTFALFAAAALMSSHGASAQALAVADIPFDFTVQHTTLPQGTYVISRTGERLISLRSKDGAHATLCLVNFVDGTKGLNTGKLFFHRYGDQYFLSEIQNPGSYYGLQVPTSKAEKRAQLNEARLQNDGTTIVAMK
jgi:hypothetical protein